MKKYAILNNCAILKLRSDIVQVDTLIKIEELISDLEDLHEEEDGESDE